MAIREKAKALFKSRSRSDKDSLSKSSSTQNSDGEKWPDNVYKPGEPMPRPKYRAPPKKEHKEKLEAFSFGEAWRKKSFQSQYSPMGTRAPSRRNSSRHPSRRNSWLSMRRKSVGGKSVNSMTSEDAEKGGARHREHLGAAMAPVLTGQPEQEGDDDVHNVGISRVQSRENNGVDDRPRTAEDRPNGAALGLTTTMSTAHDHQPFTEQELALAMQRSHLAVPAQG